MSSSTSVVSSHPSILTSLATSTTPLEAIATSTATPTTSLCSCYRPAPYCHPVGCPNNEHLLTECQQWAYDCLTNFFQSAMERDCPECTLSSDCELEGSSCDGARPQCQLKQYVCQTVKSVPGAEYECYCTMDPSSCTTGCSQGVCAREEAQCRIDNSPIVYPSCECEIYPNTCDLLPSTVECIEHNPDCERKVLQCSLDQMTGDTVFPSCPCGVDANSCALLDCAPLLADSFQCRYASEKCRQSKSTHGVTRRLLSSPPGSCPCSSDPLLCIPLDCSVESATSPACMEQAKACLEQRFGSSHFACPDSCEIDIWTSKLSGVACGTEQCVFLGEVAEVVKTYGIARYECHSKLDSACSVGEYAALAPCSTAQIGCEVATLLDAFSSADCSCLLEADCTITPGVCAEAKAPSCVKKEKECLLHQRTTRLAHLPCMCTIDASTCSIDETSAECSDFEKVMACQFFLLACKASLASAKPVPIVMSLDDAVSSKPRDALKVTVGWEKLANTQIAAETMRDSPVTVTDIRLWSTGRTMSELESTGNSRLNGSEPFLEFYAPVIRADFNAYTFSSDRRRQRLTNVRRTTPENPSYAVATIHCTAQEKCNTLDPGRVGYYIETSKISSIASYSERRDFESPKEAKVFEVQLFHETGPQWKEDEVIEIVSLPSTACGVWSLNTTTDVARLDRLTPPIKLERFQQLRFSPVTKASGACLTSFRYTTKYTASWAVPETVEVVARVLPQGPKLKEVTAIAQTSLQGVMMNAWRGRMMVLGFDQPTNRPPIASTDDLRRFVTFSEMSRWGDLGSLRLHGHWNDDGSLLRVVFDAMSDENPLTLVAGDVVKVKGGAEWLDSTHWSMPSRSSVGSWVEAALPPHIENVPEAAFTTFQSIRDLTLRAMPDSNGHDTSYWTDSALTLLDDVVSTSVVCSGSLIWIEQKKRCAACGPYQRLSEDRLRCECEEGTVSTRPSLNSTELEEETCTPCAPGYQGRRGSCYLCEPGTYNEKEQQTSCTMCPINTFRNASMPAHQKCAPCGVNAVSELAAAECITCKAGYVRKDGTSRCVACPQGTYRPYNATSCFPCGPRQTTTIKGAASASECRCEEGYYDTFDKQSEARCEECPEGIKCRLDGIELLPGFWLPKQPTAFHFNHQDLHACLPSSTAFLDAPAASAICPGALVNETKCPPHSASFLCDQCEDSYFKLPRELCTECGGPLYVLLSAGSGVMFCAALYCVTVRGGVSMSVFLRFVLTLVALMSASRTEWPPPFSSVVFLLEQLDLDFNYLLRSCLSWLSTPKDLYQFQFAFPFISVAAWVTLYSVSYILSALSALCSGRGGRWLLHRLRFDWRCVRGLSYVRGPRSSLKSGGTLSVETVYMIDASPPPPIQPMVLDQVFRAALHLLCMFYITLTMRGFAFLACFKHPNGLWSMVEYPSVYCYRGQWMTTFLPLGFLMVLLNSVGVFGLFTAALLLAPYRWHYSPRFRMHFGYLIIPYRKDVWWWGVCLFVRGVLVASTSVFLASEPYIQALVLIFILSIGLAFQCRMWPFQSFYANVMDVMLHMGLIFIILAGLQFAPHDTAFLAILGTTPLVMIGSVAVLLNAFALVGGRLERMMSRKKQEKDVALSSRHCMQSKRRMTMKIVERDMFTDPAATGSADSSSSMAEELSNDEGEDDTILQRNHLRFREIMLDVVSTPPEQLVSVIGRLSSDDLFAVRRCVAIFEYGAMGGQFTPISRVRTRHK